MKLLSSTKIAIVFVLLLTAIIGGYQFATVRMIAGAKFSPVTPGKVNVVGIDPDSGYQIIVANQMAQLIQSEGGFESSSGTGEGGATSGAVKKRIPIREMLGTFKGDPVAIGEFVRIMNDIKQDETWPSNAPVWTSENIDKAFAGDQVLAKELEHDINLKLDGTPLPSVRPAALYNGIFVNFPITLTVASPTGSRQVVGRVELPFRPSLLKVVEGRLAKKNADEATIIGYYAEEARKEIDNPSRRENLRQTLPFVYSEARLKELRRAPEQVLKGAQVVINETHITGAESREVDTGDKKRYDIKMRLTDEGRKRLWKYSMDRVGSYVMLVVDGIAVAAPRISHQLTQDELTLRGMEDQVLMRDAVDAMNQLVKKD
ncbi:MAG: hypothetical protein ACAH95_18320 [Fimbriimonas sp.]